jgi:hypothetical protein
MFFSNPFSNFLFPVQTLTQLLMGGKGKKKGKKQKEKTVESAAVAEEEGAENGEGNGGKKAKKGKKGKAGKSSKFQGDIFSEAAMENAYYVCHNLMDVLKVCFILI